MINLLSTYTYFAISKNKLIGNTLLRLDRALGLNFLQYCPANSTNKWNTCYYLYACTVTKSKRK